jgi:enhancing lycopene biosynthesis protein 2/pterin-4a-carbinolamine dehydratase
MPKICVLLSGCGVFDGAEIHEAALTLLALYEAGAEVQVTAPDIDQTHVINHLLGAVSEGETRNVLVEAARIARGQITPLSEVDLDTLDGVVLPGGFGVAKNLCTFAFKGAECDVDPSVQAFLERARALERPLGFACISPALAARVFGEGTLTVGQADDPVAEAISSLGAHHRACEANAVIIDEARRVVSTPAYMLDAPLQEIRSGLKKMVDQVMTWATTGEVKGYLERLPAWTLRSGQLYRRWSFPDFTRAIEFVERVGALAEEADHHPDIELGWGYVGVSLTSHDVGEITKRDHTLAAQIDTI